MIIFPLSVGVDMSHIALGLTRLLTLDTFAFTFGQFGRGRTPACFNLGGNSGKTNRKTENRNFRIPLIGENAPSFTAESTAGLINFPFDFGRDWKMILSHPMDFTPVCSTEIIELARLQD